MGRATARRLASPCLNRILAQRGDESGSAGKTSVAPKRSEKARRYHPRAGPSLVCLAITEDASHTPNSTNHNNPSWGGVPPNLPSPVPVLSDSKPPISDGWSQRGCPPDRFIPKSSEWRVCGKGLRNMEGDTGIASQNVFEAH